jgi:hypothetical protein
VNKLKKVVLILCIVSIIVFTAGITFGGPTIFVKTDKTMYLMDPWYWVYSASKFTYWYPPYANPEFWDDDGNPRTVSFTAKIYDEKGKPISLGNVPFDVFDGETGITDGFAVEDPIIPGTYAGSFILTENDLGRDTFTGQRPKQLALRVTAQSAVKEQTVYVGRWGCDRCHIAISDAKKVYEWCRFPDGGPGGPHNWGNILGRRHGSGFTIDHLTNEELTHTPAGIAFDEASGFAHHEKTFRKQPWDVEGKTCTPCHMGEGKVRYNYWNPGEKPWLAHAKAEAVECTFCHGIEGGYVSTDNSFDPPRILTWVENSGYILKAHKHSGVPVPPDSERDPYLARQSCSNFGCHGHINNEKPGKIDNAKPDCRLCHGIHN